MEDVVLVVIVATLDDELDKDKILWMLLVLLMTFSDSTRTVDDEGEETSLYDDLSTSETTGDETEDEATGLITVVKSGDGERGEVGFGELTLIVSPRIIIDSSISLSASNSSCCCCCKIRDDEDDDADAERFMFCRCCSRSFLSRFISLSSSSLASVPARTTTLVCVPDAQTVNLLRSMPVPGTKTFSAIAADGVDGGEDPTQVRQDNKLDPDTEGDEAETSPEPGTDPLAFKISTLTVIEWSPLTTTAPRATSR